MLISADDVLAPGALARSAAVLQAHPSVGLVYGFAPVFSEAPPRPRTWLLGWTIWTGEEWLERVCARGRNVMHSPEAMMRTSVLRAIGGYNSNMPKTSDLYMWLCAAAHSDIAFVDGPDQAYYRLHGENMTTVHFEGPYRRSPSATTRSDTSSTTTAPQSRARHGCGRPPSTR